MVTVTVIFFAIYLTLIDAHTPKNTSDVIVTYEGHAEAIPNKHATKLETEKPKEATEANEVIFVPNERKEGRRNVVREDDGYLENREVRISDLIEKKTVDEIMKGRGADEMTEPPPDVFFVKGKNSDQPLDRPAQPSRRNEKESEENVFIREIDRTKPVIEDCTNLDCNNTVQSFCGGKLEHQRWKYRLFKNECYFRKVNCAFSYRENRYTSMPLERCRFIGSHYAMHYNMPNPRPIPTQHKHSTRKEEKMAKETRRFVSSRRSMSVSIDGGICNHACPISCPEDYDPQCAVSATGHRKVFINHCKVDLNSCSYKVVWHLRPLTECVGDQKADLHQNRAFIGWMQRVGIVDKKGKLVLS